MDYHRAFAISASGLAADKARLEATATNLANMQSTAADRSQLFRPLTVVTQARPLGFGAHLGRAQAGGTEIVAIVPSVQAPRLVYEPGHPYADAQGMVAYPAVDHTAEMLHLNVTLRSYEANLAAFNAAKAMATRTLDIGGNQ
jgi:flagellar basal-body rod protein FlgC